MDAMGLTVRHLIGIDMGPDDGRGLVHGRPLRGPMFMSSVKMKLTKRPGPINADSRRHSGESELA